jgi:hypothetical protein
VSSWPGAIYVSVISFHDIVVQVALGCVGRSTSVSYLGSRIGNEKLEERGVREQT